MKTLNCSASSEAYVDKSPANVLKNFYLCSNET